MKKSIILYTVAGLLLWMVFLTAPSTRAGAFMIGMGDSIGEGVQSADASFRTQPFTYLHLLAQQMGAPFPLPWIKSGPAGLVGDMHGRSRLFPFFRSVNLAVSGATVHSLLYDRADASTVKEIASETDLVLFPRQGSQMEVAESLALPLAVCWIGNNDVLSAAISFNHLDASQMTPVADFERDFTEIAARLATEKVVIFGTIPDVTNIGFLMDGEDLIKFLGSDYGLPSGDYTSIVVMLMIRFGFDDGSLLRNPDYVLDAAEVQLVQERTGVFNEFIQEVSEGYGMPVVDVHALFEQIAANPPVFFGIPITPRFLGGGFSLDGVHPSNIGHALLANAFIEKINSHFGTSIPLISEAGLEQVFLADPFVDKDGDGRVRGRPGAGLLETMGPLLGLSGDGDDLKPESFEQPPPARLRQQFIHQYNLFSGKAPLPGSGWSRGQVIKAFRNIINPKTQ